MTGIIPVLKPEGINSSRVTATVKRKTGLKAGHYGTLDPLATGVLPVMVGSSTKLSDFLEKKKIYTAVLKLGYFTDTADITGKIIEKKEILFPSESELEAAFKQFTGTIRQRPPIFSAVSVKGRRLYSYAHKEEHVEIPEREVDIYSIECGNIDRKSGEITFTVSCSAGTYIRSLCEDIARTLGNAGTMSGLVRLESAGINIEKCVGLDSFSDSVDWENYLLDPETLLLGYPEAEIHESAVRYYLNGGAVNCGRAGVSAPGIYRAYNCGKFYGLAEAVFSEGSLFVKSIWKI